MGVQGTLSLFYIECCSLKGNLRLQNITLIIYVVVSSKTFSIRMTLIQMPVKSSQMCLRFHLFFSDTSWMNMDMWVGG